MIRGEYVVTLRDFRESLKAYRRVSKKAAIAYVWCVWLIPTICGTIALLGLYGEYSGNVEFSYPALLIIGGAVGAAFGFPARYRLGVRRAFDQRKVLAKNNPMFVEFDEFRVRFIVPQGTEITYEWSSFSDFFENDVVAVLFIQDAAFHTIPKNALSQDDWSQVRQMVIEKIRKN